MVIHLGIADSCSSVLFTPRPRVEKMSTKESIWRNTARAWRQTRGPLASLLASFLLGLGALGIAEDLFVGRAVVHQPAREWPERPLPPEWRIRDRTVKYQHMFRERR